MQRANALQSAAIATTEPPMSQLAAETSEPRPPTIGRAATIFALVGPAAGPLLFALFFAIAGLWNIGPASFVAAAGYFIWFLPFFYVPLALPFLLSGVAYAVAARRLERPSLLVALAAGAAVFGALIGLLYLAAGIATLAGYEVPNTDEDAYQLLTIVSNLGTLAGVMVIGVIPSWWLARDRTAPLQWI